MFDSIQGRLEEREPTRVVVVAGGLGYAVHVPLSTYESLPPAGADVRLLLHPVVREDEWKLFGFATSAERAVFRALLRVSGVGPMIALGLLSGLRPAELEDAVVHGDIRTLTRVKGVGRKTAERIVVELRDVFAQSARAAVMVPEADGRGGDAVAALVALGVDPSEARRRVAKALETSPEAEVSEVVRTALRG